MVDTYNVIKSGVPNAIKAFDEILKPLGKRPWEFVWIPAISLINLKSKEMLDEAAIPTASLHPTPCET